MSDEGDLAAEVVAREAPVAGLVVRTANRDLQPGRLDQREGAHHLAPHAIDGAGGELTVVRCHSLAQDLRLAPRPQREATRRLGRGDMADDLRSTADQAVQVGVEGVDFLPQAVETGSVHQTVFSCAQRRYYVRTAHVKANKPQEACLLPAATV